MNVLRLYKDILRTHQAKLPPTIRVIGDIYVKEEFRKHYKADQKYKVQFIEQWTMYLETIKQKKMYINYLLIKNHN